MVYKVRKSSEFSINDLYYIMGGGFIEYSQEVEDWVYDIVGGLG